MKIDMHLHSSVSDGTDTPALLLENIRNTDIEIFSLTDHDDCLGCEMIQGFLEPGDPQFITGVELSAEEGGRKYHILGYAYDTNSRLISDLSRTVHEIRMQKLQGMLDFLRDNYGITFSEEDQKRLRHLPNPGKPHISNLMVRDGIVNSVADGIHRYLDKFHSGFKDISPEEAVSTILQAGGIPVLAHGLFGDGRQNLTEQELDDRVQYLKDLGLMGMECYYSGYSPENEAVARRVCEKYNLLATAGSDYHGRNKTVQIGEHHLADAMTDPRVREFLEICRERS